jgi:putative phosphoesterase
VGALRLLVVSDIHSNLVALNKMLEESGRFDAVICAGDIVGYGPDPAECIDIATSLGFRCVKGNHDHAVATGDASGFNPYAREAASINRRLVDDAGKAWLGRLPDGLSFDVEGIRVAVFHGSPSDPLNEYIFPEEAEIRTDGLLNESGADLLILGHTHIPYVLRSKGRALVNPGSIGQPRDGDPRASFMMVDVNGAAVSVVHRRVEYDVDEVVGRMRRLGLPEFLASRLHHGL